MGNPSCPWNQGALVDWQICGMNHYHIDGDRRLFVSMTRQNLCIKSEGDEYQVFLDLDAQAAILNRLIEATS